MIILLQKTTIENLLLSAETHLFFMQQEMDIDSPDSIVKLKHIDNQMKKIEGLKKQLKTLSKKYGSQSFDSVNVKKQNPLLDALKSLPR